MYAVKVAPDGAGFKYVDEITFLDPDGTGVKDFRPFTIRPTADGRGFYVTDWGFSGWLQDLKRGRIFKVTYVGDDVKAAPRGKDTDSVGELLKALGHPAYTERLRAQRALIARGKDAAPALKKWLEVEKAETRSIGHILWALATIDLKEGYLLAQEFLNHPDRNVRIEAARLIVSPPWTPGATLKLDTMVQANAALRRVVETDADASVRLHAIPVVPWENYDWSIARLQDEQDIYVRYSLTMRLRTSFEQWEMERDLVCQRDGQNYVLKGKPLSQDGVLLAATERYERGAIEVLTILGASDDAAIRGRAVAALARAYKERKPYAGGWWGTRPEQQKPPAREVAWEGTPKVRDAIVTALADKDPTVRKAAVIALVDMKDADTFDPLKKRFMVEKDEATRVDLVRAMAGSGAPAAAGFMRIVANNDELPVAVRLEGLAGMDATPPRTVETLLRLVDPKEPVPIQVRALETAARLRIVNLAIPKLGLASPEPTVRLAAVKTLAVTGGAEAGALVRPVVADKDVFVRIAAVQTLGALKDRESIPLLLEATAKPALKFDAMLALTRMPDKRALTIYLTGLQSKSNELRQACAQAIGAFRDVAAPLFEELYKRNELPAAVLPELQNIFNAYAPIPELESHRPLSRGQGASAGKRNPTERYV